MSERHTVERALSLVAASQGGRYGVLLQHGSMELGFYRPEGSDPQKPHDQDEVYIVLSGSGYFVHGEGRQPFESGDALFVPAGDVHRFEDFSTDFTAWVVFYGPDGGE